MRASEDAIDLTRERLIELLLDEELGEVRPPDFTASILARLESETDGAGESIARPSVSLPTIVATSPTRRGAQRYRLLAPLAFTFLAVAASVTLFLLSSRRSSVDNVARQADSATETPVTKDSNTNTRHASAEASPAINPDIPAPVAPEKKRSPAASLALDQLPFSPDRGVPAHADPQEASLASSIPSEIARLPAEKIVQQVDQHFAALWQLAELGEPATAAPEAWQDRFAQLVGHAPRATGQDTLLSSIHQESESLARRWLNLVLAPAALDRLVPEQREALVQQIKPVFQSGLGWDRLLEQLLTLQQGSSAAPAAESPAAYWLVALRSPGQVDLVDHVGRLVLNEELTCARCHDHPLRGDVTQRDFWGLAAVFQREIRWIEQDGQMAVATASPREARDTSVFFETLDGRGRVATPQLPEKLRHVVTVPTDATRRDVFAAAKQSGGLARATVDLIWQLVLDRPLMPAVADPDAPPADPHLEAVRDLLAEQLIAHDYDLSQLVHWIVRSQPFHVGPSPMYQPGRILTTEQWELADRRQRVFLDHPFRRATAPSGNLFALALEWNMPATNTVLAQTSTDDSSAAPKKVRPSAQEESIEALRYTFPVRRSQPPVAWLQSIERYDEQARHLYYVAGVNRPSPRQLEWATQLRQSAAGDTNSALHQLWWMLRHRDLL